MEIVPQPDLLQSSLIGLFADALTKDTDVLRLRKATIIEWDQGTGQNVLLFNGSLVANVPMLNTGEVIALQPGHVVALAVTGNSAFILGRITKPGNADFGSAAIDFGTAGLSISNFSVPGSGGLGLIAQTTLQVPLWADEAAVMVTATGGLKNPTGAADTGFLTVGVNGGSGGSYGQAIGAGASAPVYASSHNLLTGLTTTGSKALSIEASVAHTTAGLWAANAANSVFVHAIAMFRSTV